MFYKNIKFILLAFLLLTAPFLNGQTISNVFLKDLYKIEYIKITYKDFYDNTTIKNININRIFLEDKIVFSTNKQKNFLEKIALDNDISIKSLKIKYLDKNKNSFTKIVHFNISKNMENNILYIYENTDYVHEEPVVNIKKKHKPLSFIDFGKLSIAYLDENNYIDIVIKGCKGKEKICSGFRYKTWENKAIFEHSIRTTKMRKFNPSKHITRAEISYKSGRNPLTRLVIELSSDIVSINNIFFDGEKFHLTKDYTPNNHKKNSAYRIYFKQRKYNE